MHTMRTLIVILVLVLGSTVAVTGDEIQYLDAPKVVPGSTDAMQSPQFWIDNITGDPDRVIMTTDQIAVLNLENMTKSYERQDIHGETYSVVRPNTFLVDDPLTITSFPGDSVRVYLEQNKRFLERGTFYDFRNRTWDEDMKNALIDMVNADVVPDNIIPLHGILVEHSFNRKFPTHKKAWREQNGWLNQFGNTNLDAGMPVAVLHMSKDRDWYFVRSPIHFGWVPATNVAIGEIGEIRDFVEAPDFIVSCIYKVPVYSDMAGRNFLMDLYMGAKLKLVENTSDGYYVLVPFRGPDGAFEAVTGWVEPDAEVSVGYQPYTQRNIINTFFSLLYRPWSSGDSYYERHCCGTVRGVLKSFGINLRNVTTLQLHASDHVIAFPMDTPKEKKHELLDGHEPAITLIGSREHIIMYLGKVGGSHYVIHSTGYDYKESDTTVRMVRRVNVNDTELEGGSHFGKWTYICTVKP
ncbi:SH3 domain-containing protein [Candidatus Latescibacterota bacterium]